MSHFYGMEYPAVLAMPLKAFWAFNRNVDRLRAEAEQRHLRLLCAAQSPDAATRLSEALITEMGKPTVVEKAFDATKFKALQEQFKRQK